MHACESPRELTLRKLFFEEVDLKEVEFKEVPRERPVIGLSRVKSPAPRLHDPGPKLTGVHHEPRRLTFG